MTDSELMVRSSIQVFLARADHPKPEGFGSCCVIIYLDRTFFEPEIYFKAFKVEASQKFLCLWREAAIPTKEERYGF